MKSQLQPIDTFNYAAISLLEALGFTAPSQFEIDYVENLLQMLLELPKFKGNLLFFNVNSESIH